MVLDDSFPDNSGKYMMMIHMITLDRCLVANQNIGRLPAAAAAAAVRIVRQHPFSFFSPRDNSDPVSLQLLFLRIHHLTPPVHTTTNAY